MNASALPTIGTKFLNRAAAERHLTKILSKKEVIA